LTTPVFPTIKPLYTAAEISAAVLAMAQCMDAAWQAVLLTHPQATLTVVVVMNGAWHTGSALSLALKTPHRVAFVRVSSYQGTEQAHPPQVTWWVPPEANQYLLLVEDIVDTGHTLAALHNQLRQQADWTVWQTVSLLDKPKARQVPVHLDYAAFRVEPHQFVVGYGLDVDNQYRDLPFIGEYIPQSMNGF
jgi:hypoxanthine phosphoribosyltransferase